MLALLLTVAVVAIDSYMYKLILLLPRNLGCVFSNLSDRFIYLQFLMLSKLTYRGPPWLLE